MASKGWVKGSNKLQAFGVMCRLWTKPGQKKPGLEVDTTMFFSMHSFIMVGMRELSTSVIHQFFLHRGSKDTLDYSCEIMQPWMQGFWLLDSCTTLCVLHHLNSTEYTTNHITYRIACIFIETTKLPTQHEAYCPCCSYAVLASIHPQSLRCPIAYSHPLHLKSSPSQHSPHPPPPNHKQCFHHHHHQPCCQWQPHIQTPLLWAPCP